MKKRLLALILALAMVITITGCSGTKTEAPKTEAPKAEAPKADGSKEEKKPEAKKDMIVGFVYIGPIGDEGWTYAHDMGRLQLEKELGVKTIYKESVPEDAQIKTVIANMIDQGATAIFATSFGYMDHVMEVAKEYPNVKFFHCSGFKSSENVVNYFGRIYQPRFLSGIVAGLKSKTNKIGYVAAFEIAEVISGINAFTLGAQVVNPKAEVNVIWTHTWYDPVKEKEAAVALLNQGCDVIAQHQDTPGPILAAQEVGKFAVGYNTSAAAKAPKAYMTAPIWNFGVYYVREVKALMEGTWKAQNYFGDMNDGVVALDKLTDVAPPEAQKIVDEYTAKIKSGEHKVFQGPMYNQEGKLVLEEGKFLSDEEILNMNYFVKGVIGKIK